MKTGTAVLIAALALAALFPAAQASSQTTGTTTSTGYVVYELQATVNGTTHSVSVNDTVSPSAISGSSVVTLAVDAASSGNFTYSRVVNSSSLLFPYLPTISDQNYTYSGTSAAVALSISQQGTSQVTFQGASYTLADYAFSATVNSTGGASTTASGTLSVFPSDLLYSATFRTQTSSGSATLTSTSLPLAAQAAAPALQATSAGIGVSLAAGAVALSLGVRMKRRQRPSAPANPDHWVD